MLALSWILTLHWDNVLAIQSGGHAYYFRERIFLTCFIWRIGDWQCWDSFRWTAKRLSQTYRCIHSPPNSPPTQAAMWHWAEFPILPRILEKYTKKIKNKSPRKTSTHLTILKLTTFLNKRYHERKENTGLHTRWYLKTGLKWQNKYLTSVIQKYGKG